MFSHPIVTASLMKQLLWQHVALVLTAVFLGGAAAMFVGIWSTRPKRRNKAIPSLIVRFLSLGQAIPSLAVLGLIMAFMGIGMITAIAALSLYALVPIMRNVISGFSGVDERILDAARGMGMSPMRILWRVELPLALPTIMAGIRTATVVTVSTAALSSQIGGGGLGRLIFMGISMMDTELMFMGALPTAVLAIFADLLLGRLEKRLTRWRKTEKHERSVLA